MRIPIREQLAALVLLTTLTGLAVISIASWIVNYDRVLNLRTQHLGLTASLKAAQLATNLDLMQRSVRSLSTRVKLQTALNVYNSGANATADWTSFGVDLANALAAPQEDILTLQVMIFDNKADTSGLSNSLMNVTGLQTNVQLPSGAYLGDAVGGYPLNLYPNFTFSGADNNSMYAYYEGQKLGPDAALFLGPWQTNNSFALSSITLPVINNSSTTGIIGWMTVVLDSRLIYEVLDSPVGLEKTGVMLLIGPATTNNQFPGYSYEATLPFVSNDTTLLDTPIQFVLPPHETYPNPRHSLRAYGKPNTPFAMSTYPAAQTCMTVNNGMINNAGGEISTVNEQGYKVSVGWAIPAGGLTDWILLIEQSKAEVWQPIVTLRKVLIACVFATAGGIIIMVLPMAHYSSRPIRRLRDATARSIINMDSAPASTKEKDGDASEPGSLPSAQLDGTTSKWSSMFASPFNNRSNREPGLPRSTLKNQYPIPETVQTRRAWIQDELSDLTQYFNEMSDELVVFYGKLEERVRQRTAELETAKTAAEVANESKTLFIANISHELKTPLNGILGMCAVCMHEDDPAKIKQSLGIIYKSGDLLHNLLTDLLTFSKNQTGQISLVEGEFPLKDIGVQVKAIFENQAREGRVNFSIDYEGCRDALGSTDAMALKQYGPPGTGRVKDMHLWGDMQRILQVVINLVSNSLKFTPPEGTVSLKIRCLDMGVEESTRTGRSPSRRSSNQSGKSKKYPRLRILSRKDSDSSPSPPIQEHNQPMLVDMGEENNRSRRSVASSEHFTNSAPPNAHTVHLEFEVTDTGPGIAKHLQKKIFEPFVQGDLRLTKKFGGTGLGLSICQQLATLMHGSVSLDSEEGVGSKFTLHIPLKLVRTRADSNATSPHPSYHDGSRKSSLSFSDNPSAQAGTSSIDRSLDTAPSTTVTEPSPYFEADSQTRLVGLSQPYLSSTKAPMASPNAEDDLKKKSSKVRVLVAEDNKVNQEVVVRMLRLEEVFAVDIAKDGQEALDKVKESMQTNTPYDLILMDVNMPRKDGRESTREIRKMGFQAPIVALTAFTDDINRKECMDSGMSDFMAKPLRRPALKHVLKTYCPPPAIQEEEEKEKDEKSPPVRKGEFAWKGPDGGLDPRVMESPMVSPGTEMPVKREVV